MVDRPQTTGSKEVRDPIRIRLIGLVAQPAFATPITHDNTINQRNQEIVKPLRLRTFLERNVYRTTHAVYELNKHPGVGRQHAAADHSVARVANGRHGGCLVHIQADILRTPLHEGRSLVLSTVSEQLHGNTKGRALNLCLTSRR
jgi:hypothetical protein